MTCFTKKNLYYSKLFLFLYKYIKKIILIKKKFKLNNLIFSFL